MLRAFGLWGFVLGELGKRAARRSIVLVVQEVLVVFNTATSTQTLPAVGLTYAPGTMLVNLLNTNEIITVTGASQTPSISVPSTTAKIFIAPILVKVGSRKPKSPPAVRPVVRPGNVFRISLFRPDRGITAVGIVLVFARAVRWD